VILSLKKYSFFRGLFVKAPDPGDIVGLEFHAHRIAVLVNQFLDVLP
jgi:hypothetical protein